MAFSFKKLFSFKQGPVQISAPRRTIGGGGGVYVDEDIAMTVSAYHRGVTYIATQIAKLPWEVKDQKNKIQDGAISNLIGLQPNPEMNAFTWRVQALMNAIHHGNSYSEIQRDMAGRPIALWPIPSRAVDMIRAPDGTLLYRVRYEGTSDTAYIPVEDMFHIKNFHTKDGIVGQGLVAYAMDSLGISKAADRMASGIFVNGGMPAGVLSFPGPLNDEAYKRLKDSWSEQHGGRKSGSVAILEEGAKFEALNLEPEVLQFLESRKFGVLELSRFLGLPPTKLFDTTATAYANVENANLEVATDTLDAWACNLEMEADVKLLKGRFGGRYTELDLYSVFRGDMTTRANYFKSIMSVGAITPNEIRAREGMAPYADGDSFYIATNNYTPADRVNEVIDAQIAPKVQAPAKDVTPKEDTNTEDPASKALNNAVIQFLTK